MGLQRKALREFVFPGQAPLVASDAFEERRVAEQHAIEAAFDKLATGDLLAASALLEPHVERAFDARTLTTLSRVRSASGHFEVALDLLRRAEALDPADNKVAFFLAELLQLMGHHQAAIVYRQRVAFATHDAPAEAFLSLISTIVKASTSGGSMLFSDLRAALAGLRKAPDTTSQQLANAARLMFSIDAMATEAVALNAEAEPCPSGERELTAAWVTLRIWCAAEGLPLARITDCGEPGRRPSAVEVTNVTVHPALQWVPIVERAAPVVFSGLSPTRTRFRSEDPDSPMLMSNVSRAVIRLPSTSRRVQDFALLLGGNGSYYHDTIDYVSVLAISERMGVDRQVPLVVNEMPAPHMIELLELLGYGTTALVKVGRNAPVHFDRLLITTRLTIGGRWFDPMLAQWYRRRLVAPLGRQPPPRRKLYLSRANTQRRRLVNEGEVVTALVAAGFEVVHLEAMSVREQVVLFAQASHIVGPSGAAFTNIVYSPPGAHVTVLQNKQLVQGGGDLYFDALAASCGHATTTIECEPARLASGERSVDADLFVDVRLLLRRAS